MLAPFCSFAIVCCGIGQESSSVEKKTMEVAIPCVVGTKWVYSDGSDEDISVEITKVTRNQRQDQIDIETSRITRNSKTHFETLRQAKDGIYRTRSNGGATIDPPYCLLPLPLKTDKKWDLSMQVGKAKLEGHGQVHAIKEIAVPAGKYKAVEVRMEVRYANSTEVISVWYATDVGMIKTVSHDQTLELKAFVIGKQ
jgi:hypothetical protein